MSSTRIGCALALLAGLAAVTPVRADLGFSRLVVVDVRGANQDETALILEQRDGQVRLWLRDYLGRRQGDVPADEYQACFDAMRRIQAFALKKEYRGKLLRTRAARGMITLAWKDVNGKQVKNIRYYAPEHTLDDFREAFNRIWALSRYAILSPDSLESPRLELREDALYFLSGAGWMTLEELNGVVTFYRSRGAGSRMAAAVWNCLGQTYASVSEFSKPEHLRYGVRKAMLRLGEPAMIWLRGRLPDLRGDERELAETILQARNSRARSGQDSVATADAAGGATP